MKVPIVEQPLIIDKVFTEVERADNPQCAIACLIKDFTLFCQTVTMAYRSECFEEVRIDSLEDTERQKQCVICRESRDHVEDIEEGIDRSRLTMPVVEQTAEPSWPQLHWPMLLTASAGGILTAILMEE
ncbi:hypothetical protein ACLB2K_049090 [Fragaria x ananassa]